MSDQSPQTNVVDASDGFATEVYATNADKPWTFMFWQKRASDSSLDLWFLIFS